MQSLGVKTWGAHNSSRNSVGDAACLGLVSVLKPANWKWLNRPEWLT